MRIRWKALLKTLTAALGLLLLLAVGSTLWLRGSLPQSDGTLNLEGLQAPVTLRRDDDGILTIQAETEADAYFALGFAHAQDRLWQMDFMRRTAAGRLSEVVGEATLAHDRFMRAFDFQGLADANLAVLDEPTRQALTAYSQGVNQYLASHSGPWSPAILLLRYDPEPWRARDSLLWGRLMALSLSNNWQDELIRARLESKLAPTDIEALWPAYPENAPVTLAEEAPGTQGALTDGLPLRELAAAVPPALRPTDASNSWVLAGGRSATGSPLLANDPHLELSAPGFWYLVRIETPDLTLVGATAPGVPFLILGHNGQVAWGFTTTHGDTQDFFIEKVTPEDPERYLTPDGPRPFATRVEEIAVKDQQAKRITYRQSRHGPIMDDVLGKRRPDWAQDRRLALAWTALDDEDRTAQALYHMNHAGDAASFKAALAAFDSPEQNIVYADRAGHIGFLAAGRVPIRKAGDGRQPVPGWDGAHDWVGVIPFEDLPQDQDPADGNFIAANNKIVPDSYPYLITADWQRPFRALRIAELLEGLPRSRLEDAQTMQLDIVSPGAGLMLPKLLAAVATREDTAAFYEMLSAWDGKMDRQRAEPLIYAAWITALNEALLRDELGDAFGSFQRPDPARLANIMEKRPLWCDDTTTPDPETCVAIISESLTLALTFLGQEFGNAPQKWRWGDAHFAPFEHPIFSRVPLIAKWLSFGLETDGGDDTLNRGVSRYAGPVRGLFEHVAGAGYRAVYDLSDLDNSRFISATGQSGNPLSPYYGNMTQRWRDGLYLTIPGQQHEALPGLVLQPR